jgi:ABC-type proline/glycine betaine transport system permease subunit
MVEFGKVIFRHNLLLLIATSLATILAVMLLIVVAYDEKA